MASPAQKYRFNGLSTLSAENIEQLDEMLEDLYTYLTQSPLGTTAGAFDTSALAADPGVVYFAAADNAFSVVTPGTAGQLLRQGTSDPEWSAITYPNTLAVGDILYASTTTNLARLADVATGNALISGGVNTAPLWGKIALATHVSGTLPVANGGTGSTSFTAGSIIYSDGSILTQDNASLKWNTTNFRIDVTRASGANTGYRATNNGLGATDAPVFEVVNSTHQAVFFVVPAAHGTIPSTAGIYTDASNGFVFYPDAVTSMRIDSTGRIAIGSAGYPGTGNNFIVFPDATPLATLATDTAGIFADSVNGDVNMFAVSEAGAINQLSGLHIRKTTDESVTNSTTHQADDHLTVNLAGTSSYAFEIHGNFTTAGATAGITVQLDGTVGVSSLMADVFIYDHAANAISALARITAFNSAVGAGLTGDNSFLIRGTIETTTTGTMLLEWAQNSADAGNATTLQENSYFILHKLNA